MKYDQVSERAKLEYMKRKKEQQFKERFNKFVVTDDVHEVGCSSTTSSSGLIAINSLCELKRPPQVKPKFVPKISSFSTTKLKPLIKPRSLSVVPVMDEFEAPPPDNFAAPFFAQPSILGEKSYDPLMVAHSEELSKYQKNYFNQKNFTNGTVTFDGLRQFFPVTTPNKADMISPQSYNVEKKAHRRIPDNCSEGSKSKDVFDKRANMAKTGLPDKSNDATSKVGKPVLSCEKMLSDTSELFKSKGSIKFSDSESTLDENLSSKSTLKELNSPSDGLKKKLKHVKFTDEDKVYCKEVEANSTLESATSSKELEEPCKRKRRKTVDDSSTNQCALVELIDVVSTIKIEPPEEIFFDPNDMRAIYEYEQKVAKSSAKIVDTEDIPFSSTVTFSCPLNSTSPFATASPANLSINAAIDLGVNGPGYAGVQPNSSVDLFSSNCNIVKSEEVDWTHTENTIIGTTSLSGNCEVIESVPLPSKRADRKERDKNRRKPKKKKKKHNDDESGDAVISTVGCAMVGNPIVEPSTAAVNITVDGIGSDSTVMPVAENIDAAAEENTDDYSLEPSTSSHEKATVDLLLMWKLSQDELQLEKKLEEVISTISSLHQALNKASNERKNINNQLIKIREKKLELLQPELKKESVKVTSKSEIPQK